jgi:hypothetical protein
MSMSGVGHIRLTSLKLGRETVQVWFRTERADMSGSRAGHVWPTTLEPSLGTKNIRSGDLVAEESG